MAIQVSGTTVIDGSRNLVNVIGLKTVGGTAILGSGDIAVGGSTTAGAVGTYALLLFQGSGALYAGDTAAGSDLRYATASANNSGTPSGTWGCMGHAQGTTGNPANVTSFVRIS
jgi:hypothetical protein